MVRRIWVGLAVVIITSSSVSFGAAGRVPLPTPADAAGPGFDSTQLTGGPTFGTTGHAPGPIVDSEIVRVFLDASGAPERIDVDQTLSLSGTGDYSLSIQGPALAVEAPSDQVVQPGLRRGRIVWQGFVNGSQTLRSRVTLDPTFELSRLPIEVSIRVADPNGTTLQPPFLGPVRVRVTVTNVTARPAIVRRASPDPSAVSGLLDRLIAAVSAGKRPIAGVGGIPADLEGSGPVADAWQDVSAPVVVRGSIAGQAIAATLTSSTPKVFEFEGQGQALGIDVRVQGGAADLDALKQARRAVAAGGATADAYEAAQRGMWQALRAGELDAHLGNPGRGRSSTIFMFQPRPAAQIPKAVKDKLEPLGLTLASIALFAASANAFVLWRRA